MKKHKSRKATSNPAWTTAGAVVLGFLFLLMFIGFSGQSQAETVKGSEVLARWGNHVITQADLDFRIKSLPFNAQMQLGSPEAKREFLESLVQLQMIGAEARKDKLEQSKKVKVAVEDMTNSILVQEYMTKKLSKVKKPGDKEVEAYYKQNQNEFKVPAMVKAQHILIKADSEAKPEEVAAAQAKAENILKEVAAGEDFTKLVEKYSEDQGSKARGGDLGQFSKDQMVPEFSDVVFNMKKGEVSKVVKTPLGFHIIKVNETTPARVLELAEASDTIGAKLYKEKQEKLVMKELDRIKKKYKVKISMPESADEKVPVQDNGKKE